jgi:hypothetical protein
MKRTLSSWPTFFAKVSSLVRLLALAALSAELASCGRYNEGQCFPPPCPFPFAIIIDVTAEAGGGPVNGAFVKVSGATVSTIPCDAGPTTTCHVPGLPGTYTLEVGAPGFQSAQRTVVVHGTNPECGCPTVNLEHLDVALVATP